MEQPVKAIQVSNLSFAYNGIEVLGNINFDIEAGKLCFILGQNGCGKSTLLKILAGIAGIQAGTVKFFGSNSSAYSYSERARVLGFLNQRHEAVFPFTVEDVVLTGRAAWVKFIPGESDKKAAQQALEKAGIRHLAKRCYTELSGGEQQLVMIARLLAQNPRILLLDEPATYLDLPNQSHLFKLLKTLVSEGLTVITVVHDPNLAFVFGDDFLFIKDKKVIRSGNSYQPWDTEFLSSIYDNRLVTIPYNGRALLVPHLN